MTCGARRDAGPRFFESPPMKDLFAALCLMAVFEGLLLFVAPLAWKRMAERLLDLPGAALRRFGGLVLLAGLSLLWWVRHG